MTKRQRKQIETDILIVGAGMAGLIAGKHLSERGWQVQVRDKGRGLGGRMATRRIGPGRADHGAQFFTVRHPEFQRYVDEWLEAGVVYEWARGWGEAQDGYPRYAGHKGMTAVPKYLARNLNVHTGMEITTTTVTDAGWRAVDADGHVIHSRALLLTPPIPQSLALLDAGDVRLHPHDRAALSRISYAPCLCGLFWIDGQVNLPAPGAVQQLDQPIVWLADNQRKGISPAAKLITVHGGPEYSITYWDAPKETALAGLRAELKPYLAKDATLREVQLKRWRYALPLTHHPERCLLAQDTPPLTFAGDAFKEPRVEGASLSGLDAARALDAALRVD